MGNLRVGAPALTTTLRGDVAAIVKVRTLEHPLHSGVFGGPAPDAMMALARLLSTLHDEAGDVAIAGVTRHEPPEAELSDEEFLASADLLPGVQLIGTGSVGARLWTSPSVSAIGIDMTSIAESSNVLIPEAAAKVSMRIVPGSDPVRELDALVAHLESHAPWGAQVEVERVKQAPPFTASTAGPAYAAAREALEGAYGAPPSEVGSGGSIPLLDTLRSAAPDAEFILWGPEDVAPLPDPCVQRERRSVRDRADGRRPGTLHAAAGRTLVALRRRKMSTQFQADLAPTQFVDGPQGETFAYRRLGTPSSTPPRSSSPARNGTTTGTQPSSTPSRPSEKSSSSTIEASTRAPASPRVRSRSCRRCHRLHRCSRP